MLHGTTNYRYDSVLVFNFFSQYQYGIGNTFFLDSFPKYDVKKEYSLFVVFKVRDDDASSRFKVEDTLLS